MNFKIRIFLYCIFFTLISCPVFSQVNTLSAQNLSSVKIDNVTDAEIKSYYLKAQDNGLTDENIYSLLKQRGLPDNEIDKLEGRLKAVMNDVPSMQKQEEKLPANEKRDRYSNQQAGQVPLQMVQNDLTIFGSEMFTTNSTVFEPNLRIPAPSNYILGPDDELVINVFGYSEKTYNVTVNAEGNIYIPQVGPLFVNGLSMEEATLKIRAKLASTIYKAVNSGQTKVEISLGKIRSIRVTVIGEAKKPGNFTVSSLTTLFNLLYLCGGPSDLGSYRKIELIRGNELKRTIDLYSFLLRGDQKDNLLLQEGDVIRIPYYQTRILLNGNVKRKGKYELTTEETFGHVLTFSGGFSDDAYKAGVTVYQLTETGRKILNVSKIQFLTFKPLSGDSVIVGQLLNRFENKLTVKGAVMRPGEYELTAGLALKELIEKAGGVKEDVYNRRGTISRLNDNNTPIQVSFNIDSIMNNLVSIALKKNDQVTIFSIFDFTTPGDISIDGLVNKPGKYKWAENLSLDDVILEAGGLTESADMTNIEIARRIENVNLSEVNQIQTEILNIDLSANSNVKDITLKPFDVINIRQRPGFALQRTVYLDGMVINPGRYTLKMSGDKINDILKRSGGFRANADTNAIIIRRVIKKNQSLEEREKVISRLLRQKEDSIVFNEYVKKEIFKDYENISIDLDKALKEPESSENMLLEDGDVLTVENNTNLVKVGGEIYYPTIIPFKKNERLNYYIKKSGSYTPLARKKGTLVIYPDGRAAKVKSFLFFTSYPRVVSRSEIFVPVKSYKNRSRISVGEWSVVASTLAIIANVIINSRK